MMAKICYILLCHKNPEQIAEQVELLTGSGDFVCVHFDARAGTSNFNTMKERLKDNPNVCFANRVKGGWGEWSLVKGSLNAVRAGYSSFPEATHFYLISGDCMPIKPASYIHSFLDNHNTDYIEHNDFFESDWIKVGFKEERLIYRHWFNERANKPLFYMSVAIQRALGMRRELPKGLSIMIGSQWWCLRRSSVSLILDFLKERPDVIRFFKTTWIPDETFFQTLIMHLVPRNEVESRTPTFLSFSDYGLPTVFYQDHKGFLLSQNYMFARKISSNAQGLRDQLALEFKGDHQVKTGADGKRLIDYLNTRGRTGRRFSERFWERGSRIGRVNTLNIILCKKWHIGKRFADEFASMGSARSLGYVFDETGSNLPDLGQLELSPKKRTRHHRAFLKVLFERLGTNQLTVCLDPSNLATIADFAGDRCELRILEVKCEFDDDYLAGHAQRIGLSDEGISPDLGNSLVLAIRNSIQSDHEDLQEMKLPNLHLIDEKASEDANAVAIAGFLKVPQHRAEKIMHSLSFD